MVTVSVAATGGVDGEFKEPSQVPSRVLSTLDGWVGGRPQAHSTVKTAAPAVST
jgi:hypothetical protein